MQKKYHLIAGLPRSGSTLLASILNQNPRFHTSVTDVLCFAVKDAIHAMSLQMHHSVLTEDSRKAKVLQGMFDNFYHDANQEVVFNVNRSWVHAFHAIHKLSPETKMILCVRDIAWILNSFELLYQKNAFNLPSIYGFEQKESYTVYGRSRKIFDVHIGLLLEGMKEVCYGIGRKNVMILDYDDLCKTPQESMARIYDFIEETRYNHDFDNVEMMHDDMDTVINAPGLHYVKKKVAFEEKIPVIPPDLWHNMQGMEFWKK
jgi:sulfotransferase